MRHTGTMESQAVAYLVFTNHSRDVVRNIEINVSDSNDIQLVNEVNTI